MGQFITTEQCPHCENEHEITEIVQPCPTCKLPLVACSMCSVPSEQGVRCGGCKEGTLFNLAKYNWQDDD